MTTYNEFDSIWAPPNRAVDDSGAVYASIQAAVDNAENLVLVGPGSFEESVKVTNDDFVLKGTGSATKIASQSGEYAIQIDGKDVSVTEMEVSTQPGCSCNRAVDILSGSSRADVVNVVVTASGGVAFHVRGAYAVSTENLTIEGDLEGDGILTDTNTTDFRVDGARIIGVGEDAIHDSGDYNLYNGIVIGSPGCHGVHMVGNDTVVGDVTIRDAGCDGARFEGRNQTFGNSRITGSTDDDLNADNATNFEQHGINTDALFVSKALEEVAQPVVVGNPVEWVSRSFSETTSAVTNFDVTEWATRVLTEEPDGIIEDFEGGDLADYDGDTGDAIVQNNVVFEGTYAVEFDSSGTRIYDPDRRSAPSQGDSFSVRVRSSSDDPGDFHWVSPLFGVQDGDNFYQIRVNFSDQNDAGGEIWRYENGAGSRISSVNADLVEDAWYELYVEWDDGSTFGGAAGDIDARLYDSAGREVWSLFENDTTYSRGGWGFYGSAATSGESVFADWGVHDRRERPSFAVRSISEMVSVADSFATSESEFLIDGFESGDLSAYYVNSMSGFDVQTGTVHDGTYALEFVAGDAGSEIAYSFDGLDNYPSRGDTVRYWVNLGENSVLGFGFACQQQNESDWDFWEDAYHVGINYLSGGTDRFRLRKGASGSLHTMDEDQSELTPKGQWNYIDIEFDPDDNGTIKATMYDSSDDSVIATVEDTDTEYDAGGVYWYSGDDPDDAAYADLAQII